MYINYCLFKFKLIKMQRKKFFDLIADQKSFHDNIHNNSLSLRKTSIFNKIMLQRLTNTSLLKNSGENNNQYEIILSEKEQRHIIFSQSYQNENYLQILLESMNQNKNITVVSINIVLSSFNDKSNTNENTREITNFILSLYNKGILSTLFNMIIHHLYYNDFCFINETLIMFINITYYFSLLSANQICLITENIFLLNQINNLCEIYLTNKNNFPLQLKAIILQFITQISYLNNKIQQSILNNNLFVLSIFDIDTSNEDFYINSLRLFCALIYNTTTCNCTLYKNIFNVFAFFLNGKYVLICVQGLLSLSENKQFLSECYRKFLNVSLLKNLFLIHNNILVCEIIYNLLILDKEEIDEFLIENNLLVFLKENMKHEKIILSVLKCVQLLTISPISDIQRLFNKSYNGKSIMNVIIHYMKGIFDYVNNNHLSKVILLQIVNNCLHYQDNDLLNLFIECLNEINFDFTCVLENTLLSSQKTKDIIILIFEIIYNIINVKQNKILSTKISQSNIIDIILNIITQNQKIINNEVELLGKTIIKKLTI